MENIAIFGSGSHSTVVAETLKLLKINFVIYDDKKEKDFYGNTILKCDNVTEKRGICAIGDDKLREKIVNKINKLHTNFEWINVIHPNAVISKTCKIGSGNFINAGCIINASTRIKNHNIINTNASIDHDCSIGDFNHFAPGSVLCGDIKIGNNNLFGAHSTIINKLNIGNNNIIGASSCIIRNIQNNGVYVGVPGKKINDIK